MVVIATALTGHLIATDPISANHAWPEQSADAK